MSRTIVITSRHDLGVEGAKRRITERFDVLKASYLGTFSHAQLRWDGDVGHATATALGQTVTGRIPIEADALRIEIELPLLLAPFGGAIESVLRGNADALQPESKAGGGRVGAPPTS